MKLITVNYYQVHMTLTTLSLTLTYMSQRWSQKSCGLDYSWTTGGISIKTYANTFHSRASSNYYWFSTSWVQRSRSQLRISAEAGRSSLYMRTRNEIYILKERRLPHGLAKMVVTEAGRWWWSSMCWCGETRLAAACVFRTAWWWLRYGVCRAADRWNWKRKYQWQTAGLHAARLLRRLRLLVVVMTAMT